jgi:hypothetical protein
MPASISLFIVWLIVVFIFFLGLKMPRIIIAFILILCMLSIVVRPIIVPVVHDLDVVVVAASENYAAGRKVMTVAAV